MIAKVMLFSNKNGEINNFLSKFYNSDIVVQNPLSWKKDFQNPVEISEFVAALSDNDSSFDVDMWISLDKDVFIKISPLNADIIIKYIFERYPY